MIDGHKLIQAKVDEIKVVVRFPVFAHDEAAQCRRLKHHIGHHTNASLLGRWQQSPANQIGANQKADGQSCVRIGYFDLIQLVEQTVQCLIWFVEVHREFIAFADFNVCFNRIGISFRIVIIELCISLCYFYIYITFFCE